MTVEMTIIIIMMGIMAIFALLLALAFRQIGILHQRIAPFGALTINKGLRPGDAVDDIYLQTLAGTKIALARLSEKPLLVFFVSTTCPLCKDVIALVKRIDQDEPSVDCLVVGSEAAEDHLSFALSNGIPLMRYAVNAGFAIQLGVNKLPYAVVVRDALIRSAGLVNTREQIESLLLANELNVSSWQQWAIGSP